LRDFAQKQEGWKITHYYNHHATGKDSDRDGFRSMMKAASQRRFDVLLFWSLDRLTREGTFKTLCYLRQLSAVGVKYKSLTEQYIDSLGIFSEAIVGIIGAIAEQERHRISKRTKAGMARVAATGKHCGRPRAEVDVARLRRLRQQELTITAIAKRTRLSRALVWNRLKV
jgi:DNA invertase Pin-like site-specific DNA recombinase